MTDASHLAARTAADPHAFLGAHPDGDGGVVIRAFRPAAQAVRAHTADGQVVELAPAGGEGVFEGAVDGASLPLEYELEVDYGENGIVHGRRPVPLPADARRHRPPPRGRGPPRGALGASSART